jgi:hypothetical protein
MIAQAEPIAWVSDLSEAQARAAAQDRPMLLDFSAAPQ